MPLGLLSDDEFDREFGKREEKEKESHIKETQIVDRPRNEVTDTPIIEELGRKGRKDGDVDVPDALRQIIGEEHLVNGRQAAIQLAKDFGISSSSVSAYAKGATSTTSYNSPKPSIIDHINKSRARITKRAQSTLHHALSAITQDKLDYADADKLSGIAKDMSVIIKNMEPKEVVGESKQDSPQFVIFAPQFRDERSFGEVIKVNE